MADYARVAWLGVETLTTADVDIARTAWLGVETLTTEDLNYGRVAWLGSEALTKADVDFARVAWSAAEVLTTDPIDVVVSCAPPSLTTEEGGQLTINGNFEQSSYWLRIGGSLTPGGSGIVADIGPVETVTGATLVFDIPVGVPAGEYMIGVYRIVGVELFIEISLSFTITQTLFPCPIETLTFNIQNVVTVSNKYKPLTGLYSTDESISGWVWDRRVIEDWSNTRTRYDTFLGGHSVGLRDATKLEDWQSGTVSNLENISPAHYRVGDDLTWTPRVTTGAYSLYFDKRNLYSDYSYSENVDLEQDVNGLNTVTLRSDSVNESIQVAIWSRTNNYLIFKAKNFEYVDVFSGELDETSHSRLATEDDIGNILYDNLASRKHEYIIRGDKLILNSSYSIEVGRAGLQNINLAEVPCLVNDYWENKGDGSQSGRDLFTNYFPLQRETVRVVTESNDTLTEWVEVASLDFSRPEDKHFVVDYDLGIITIGGYQADSLTLKEELFIDDIEVVVYFEPSIMETFPEKGVIVIGSEEIMYFGKTRDRFVDCVRGHNATQAVYHEVGSRVDDLRHGQGSTDTFYVSYTAVPRIDYEVTPNNIRSANKGSWLDIRPIKNVETNNILQLHSSLVHLDSIVLETSSPLIGGNLYGPVYYGTDVSRMTARALDSQDNPVEGIELTIQIISGGGLLNGVSTSRTAFSNTLGEIYALFNSPYSKDRVELVVKNTSHSGTNTIMTLPTLEAGTKPEDVWVYQVLKHDKILGTTGLQRVVTGEEALVAPYGNQGLVIDGLVRSEDYISGFIYLLGTDGVKYFRNIVTVRDTVDVDDRPVSLIGLDAALPSGVYIGQPIWLFEEEAKVWNPVLLNGARVILYEFSNSAIHPITKMVGAYAPIHPNSVTSTTLTFNDRLLPIPDPIDDSNNLGAYTVIAPSEVFLQAYGKDPVSGRVVKSNIIRLALRLPSFLTGVDSSGVLPIPYGWTMVSEEFNIGAGLGGANFITINPTAEGINQFSLRGVF